MSPTELRWQCEEMTDDVLVLRVCQAMTARDFASQMLGSRAAVKKVFAQGQLQLDGHPLSGGDPLGKGALVTLHLVRDVPAAGESAPLPKVVFQDPLLLAVDKPAGVLVHGDGTKASTLTAGVMHLLAQQDKPAKVQAVQRLDTQTTGIVLFSLAEEFQPMLDAQVAGHDMRKRYLAVVEGSFGGSDGWTELDGPIARDRHDARRMRVGATGKPALTLVRNLAQRKGRSLLLVQLMTGRKHQIRVHLAHAGHPIVGDALYGGTSHNDGLMLHAWSEQVVHPATYQVLELQTPVPQRFRRLFPQTIADE